ncbi:hypothetical protein Hanom_Chr04g00354711 [Helianthus anomalus]
MVLWSFLKSLYLIYFFLTKVNIYLSSLSHNLSHTHKSTPSLSLVSYSLTHHRLNDMGVIPMSVAISPPRLPHPLLRRRAGPIIYVLHKPGIGRKTI